MESTYTISISTAWILIAVMAIIILGLLAVVYHLYKVNSQNKQFEEQYVQLEKKMNSFELERVHYKLNPHLFKNTLNAIQSHAYQTYHALDKLSNVLDYILYESEQQFVTLRQEIEFAMSLIEINKLKVSPLFDLRISKKIDEADYAYDQKLIAPLITVDLIENAFKHADLQREDAFIAIVFELRDGEFFLTVSNKISNTPSLKKKGSGFGKQHIKKRLDHIYKGHYKLDHFIEQDVHIAHLKINLREHQAQMLTVG